MPIDLQWLVFPGSGGSPDFPTDPAGDPFGVDILFTDRKQLSAAGDYITIGGRENLRLAIYRRLDTNPGEYKLRPQYGAGLRSYVKKPRTKAILDEARGRCLEQIAREKRIQLVTALELNPADLPSPSGPVPAIIVQLGVRSAGQEIRFQPMTFTERR